MGITAPVEGNVQAVSVNNHSNGDVAAKTSMAMAQFLAAELETADTLTHTADMLRNSTEKARCIAIARKAYDTALRFLPRATLAESESERFQELLDSLRSRLEALEECFDTPKKAPENGDCPGDCIGDDVQRFLVGCKQLRRNAQQMLRYNKVLMNRTRK